MTRNQPTPLAIYSALLALALQGQVALAQDASRAPSYPTWVTNDYPCVIKCIEDQLKDQQPPATDGQVSGAMGCVRDACSQETAQGNVYQAHYIINMFNTIGSIYEPESWQAGNEPNASDLTAPQDWVQIATTATWTESDEPTTITTSVWAPSSTSEPPATTSAVSAGTGEDVVVAPSASVSGSAVASSVARPSVSGNATAGRNGTANATSTVEGAGYRLAVDVGVATLALLGAGLVGGAVGGAGLLSW